eukprot:765910-Hanusia_phi.AAC.2
MNEQASHAAVEEVHFLAAPSTPPRHPVPHFARRSESFKQGLYQVTQRTGRKANERKATRQADSKTRNGEKIMAVRSYRQNKGRSCAQNNDNSNDRKEK